MLDLDLRDSRLKDVIVPNQLLKALVLLKSGKTTEAVTLAEEIIGAYPTDESTLNVVMCYFRETGQTHREAEYLKTALKKCPDREDLLVYLFLNQVQSGSFAEQQTTARLLSQQFPSPLYIYWVIVSTTMQAEADPVLGKRMYLPLAEKMLLREASANRMRKHSEFQLLLDVLRRLEKQNDALQFLNNSTLTDRLDELDYRCDYSIERLNLHIVLDLWEGAFKLGEEKLDQNPNDWNTWKCLIELSTAQSTRDLNAPRLDRLDALLSTFMDRHPNVRGPHLARLDLSANLLRRGWDLPHNTDVPSLLHTYINKFAVKPICAFDVAYLLPLLLPAEAEVTQVCIKVLCIADSKQTYRHLCAYQVARANRYPVSLIDLIQTYFTFVPERATFPPNLPKQLGDEQANASAVDLCPADGFLLLILSALSENPTLPTVSRGPGALALALLAAYWVEYSGVARASNNHHFRLRLCSLFSPHALACTDMSLAQTDRLDVKQLLYVSLGYTIISANPMLTLWSSIQSQTSQHQQQTDTSPMLAIHHHVRDLSSVTVNEARDGILAAYRRGAYVKVREFTQFTDRLRHADVFLTTRIELLYWQLAVVPDKVLRLMIHRGCHGWIFVDLRGLISLFWLQYPTVVDGFPCFAFSRINQESQTIGGIRNILTDPASKTPEKLSVI
ncbi:N-alpha-acetyltransferase 25 NatB auxiliary subunit [Clonorchis sinensis]|uniref:N-alpha-acetyltransferase 25 NatB auxiliary subunit n=1 Tax=Clonorchis sinensis TaxID=79923 RepID=H2KNU0_CLOSI|nr:N-alpha-acetyltransferase 25 NatB auxiliary subunit [Clonorchis sinensis]